MPNGTGRGDGDEGSPTNRHIGYLKITGPTPSSNIGKIKPYIRSAEGDIPQKCGNEDERANVFGFRLPTNGRVNDFIVRRYWLVRMCDDDNKYWENDETSGYNNFDPKRPYIKIAEIRKFEDNEKFKPEENLTEGDDVKGRGKFGDLDKEKKEHSNN